MTFAEASLAPKPSLVSLDTSFFVRLLGAHFPLHKEANEYYNSFSAAKLAMSTSVVAVGEYLVKGEKSELPLRDVQLTAFNLQDAELAAQCARVLYKERVLGNLDVEQRIVIPNDVKIFASTQLSNCVALVTADKRSDKLHSLLQQAGLITFELWHISKSLSENRGVLNLPA